jgi:hypothetical protein
MTLLRPGLHVVRRDDRHLQVGVDPPWRLVVPDEPDVQRLLADLAVGRQPLPETPAAHRVLAALLSADMVVDRGARAASVRARSAAAVSVEAGGRPAADALRILRAARCGVAPPGVATVALVLAAGEPRREVIDAHLREGRPHLPVAATAHGYTLGPFVVPGVTACQRCVDAHLGEHDPRRAVIVEQLGGRESGPGDQALEAVATAWAVRDVLAFVDGDRPSTWSATVEIGTDLRPRRREWTRHPYCGCAWDLTAAPGHRAHY